MKLEIITHLLSSLLDPTARKTIFFPRRPEKMVFPKKMPLEYDLSGIIEKDDISFFRKYDLTPYMENER